MADFTPFEPENCPAPENHEIFNYCPRCTWRRVPEDDAQVAEVSIETEVVPAPVQVNGETPENVTPEQEAAIVDLADQFVKGNLLVGDAVLARIRTFVPILVGPALSLIVTNLPAVSAWLGANIPGWQEIIFAIVSVGLGYGWWSLARFLGKRWPLAEKIMLGSSKAPVYIDRVDSIVKP